MAQSKTKSVLQPVIASDFGNSKHDLKHRLSMIVSTRNRKSLGAVCIAIVIAVSFSGTVIAVTDVTNNSDITSISMPDKQQPSEDESIFTSTTTTTGSVEHEYEGYYTTSTVRTTSTSGTNTQTTTATWTAITTVTTAAPYTTSAPHTTPTVINQNNSNTTAASNAYSSAETTTTTATVYNTP